MIVTGKIKRGHTIHHLGTAYTVIGRGIVRGIHRHFTKSPSGALVFFSPRQITDGRRADTLRVTSA